MELVASGPGQLEEASPRTAIYIRGSNMRWGVKTPNLGEELINFFLTSPPFPFLLLQFV